MEKGLQQWYLLEGMQATTKTSSSAVTSKDSTFKEDWHKLDGISASHQTSDSASLQSRLSSHSIVDNTMFSLPPDKANISQNSTNMESAPHDNLASVNISTLSQTSSIQSKKSDGDNNYSTTPVQTFNETDVPQLSPNGLRLNLQESIDGEISDSYIDSWNSLLSYKEISNQFDKQPPIVLENEWVSLESPAANQLFNHSDFQWNNLQTSNIQDINRPEPLGVATNDNSVKNQNNLTNFSSVLSLSPTSSMSEKSLVTSDESKPVKFPSCVALTISHNITTLSTSSNITGPEEFTTSKINKRVESAGDFISNRSVSSNQSHRSVSSNQSHRSVSSNDTNSIRSSSTTYKEISPQRKTNLETPITKFLGPSFKETENFLKNLQAANFDNLLVLDNTNDKAQFRNQSMQTDESKLDDLSTRESHTYDSPDHPNSTLIEQDISSASTDINTSLHTNTSTFAKDGMRKTDVQTLSDVTPSSVSVSTSLASKEGQSADRKVFLTNSVTSNPTDSSVTIDSHSNVQNISNHMQLINLSKSENNVSNPMLNNFVSKTKSNLYSDASWKGNFESSISSSKVSDMQRGSDQELLFSDLTDPMYPVAGDHSMYSHTVDPFYPPTSDHIHPVANDHPPYPRTTATRADNSTQSEPRDISSLHSSTSHSSKNKYSTSSNFSNLEPIKEILSPDIKNKLKRDTVVNPSFLSDSINSASTPFEQNSRYGQRVINEIPKKMSTHSNPNHGRNVNKYGYPDRYSDIKSTPNAVSIDYVTNEEILKDVPSSTESLQPYRRYLASSSSTSKQYEADKRIVDINKKINGTQTKKKVKKNISTNQDKPINKIESPRSDDTDELLNRHPVELNYPEKLGAHPAEIKSQSFIKHNDNMLSYDSSITSSEIENTPPLITKTSQLLRQPRKFRSNDSSYKNNLKHDDKLSELWNEFDESFKRKPLSPVLNKLEMLSNMLKKEKYYRKNVIYTSPDTTTAGSSSSSYNKTPQQTRTQPSTKDGKRHSKRLSDAILDTLKERINCPYCGKADASTGCSSRCSTPLMLHTWTQTTPAATPYQPDPNIQYKGMGKNHEERSPDKENQNQNSSNQIVHQRKQTWKTKSEFVASTCASDENSNFAYTAWFQTTRSDDNNKVYPLSKATLDNQLENAPRRRHQRKVTSISLQEAFELNKRTFMYRSKQRVQQTKDHRLEDKHGGVIYQVSKQRSPLVAKNNRNHAVVEKAVVKSSKVYNSKEYLRKIRDNMPLVTYRQAEEEKGRMLKHNRQKMKQYDAILMKSSIDKLHHRSWSTCRNERVQKKRSVDDFSSAKKRFL